MNISRLKGTIEPIAKDKIKVDIIKGCYYAQKTKSKKMDLVYPKYLGDYINDKVELEIYECGCGYHFAVDSTYLEQVDSIKMPCPSCNRKLLVGDEDSL